MRLLWTGAGVAVTGLVAMVSATVAVMNQIAAVKESIAVAVTQVNARVDELSRKLDGRTYDRWTLSMEREEMSKMQQKNPMWIAVDVAEIWSRIKPLDTK